LNFHFCGKLKCDQAGIWFIFIAYSDPVSAVKSNICPAGKQVILLNGSPDPSIRLVQMFVFLIMMLFHDMM